MTALTHVDAKQRTGLLDVRSMQVSVDVCDDKRFYSQSVITFGCAVVGAETFLDCRAEQVQSLILNGAPIDAKIEDGRIYLTGLQETNTVEVQGFYSYSNDGEGLHQHVDPTDQRRYLYVMSFLDAAPRWCACFDQPDLKVPLELTVTAPPDWTVYGNGPAHRVCGNENQIVWQLSQPRPIATYLMTFVAGPWYSILDSHDGIPLGLHCRQSMRTEMDKAKADILRVTKQGFTEYHRLFDIRYPFGEYHQAFVTDFNAGAMENPGCVVYRDQLLFRGTATETELAGRANTVIHEMAHQWFGDLVTMCWWDDLWLNESFAEYMAQRVCSDATDYKLWATFGVTRKFHATQADQRPSTHPVAADEAADTDIALSNFDAISYSKGASLVKQLVALISDEAFLSGVNQYFAQHAFGNATKADLIAAWEKAAQQDLGGWVRDWLEKPGIDTIRVKDGHIMVESHDGSRRRHAVTVGVFADDGSKISSEHIVLSADKPIPAPASGHIMPDAGDDAWAKIRATDFRHAPAISQIAQAPTRVAYYAELRDGVRSGEIDAGLAWEVLARELTSENHDAILATMLAFGSELAGAYCPINQRGTMADTVAELGHQILADANPGSDRWLQALRTVIACTRNETQLLGWLAGDTPDWNQFLDQNLRWSMVIRLSQLGEREDLIAAESARDATSTGHIKVIQARASQPITAAKEDAFRLIMHPSEAPSHHIYAAAAGLYPAIQAADLTELALRYFREIGNTASFRQGWALSTAALQAFPATVSTPEILGSAQQTLADPHLHTALRRVLVDGTDELAKAVRATKLPRHVAT